MTEAAGELDPGVVHQDIEGPDRVGGVLDELLEPGRVGEVGGERLDGDAGCAKLADRSSTDVDGRSLRARFTPSAASGRAM
jgi:hypothetical protein